MTDRRLLEDAAKAAGIEVRFMRTMSADLRTDRGELPYMVKPHKPPEWNKRVSDWCVLWNPLEDDGDALRLAVKLRIDFTMSEVAGVEYAEACVPGAPWMSESIGDDEKAATRRAIVRAAAELGRAGSEGE